MKSAWVWECESGFPGIDLVCSADDRAKMAERYGRDKVAEKLAGLTLGRAIELTRGRE